MKCGAGILYVKLFVKCNLRSKMCVKCRIDVKKYNSVAIAYIIVKWEWKIENKFGDNWN